MTVYQYGMRLRGFSPGCQPKEGFIAADDDVLGEYHNMLYYDHRLTHTQCEDFELDFIGKRELKDDG